MSQFAELFKAVKNEPKNLLANNENKKPVAVKNMEQVKAKDNRNGENKSGNTPNSDAQNLKKQTQVSEKDRTASKPVEKPPQLQEESKIVGSAKKIGKSSNADYTQVLTYMRRDTHRQIKKVLIDDPDERDLSDLVEEVLSDWLKKNV